MARYDKYEPKGGGFRAPLAADMTDAQVDTLLGVGLDVNGRAVVGGGNTGVVGVMAMPRRLNARDIADIMTNGDVVELPTALTAGSRVYSTAAGDITTAADTGGTAPVANKPVGYVVGDRNGTRLVVRVDQGA